MNEETQTQVETQAEPADVHVDDQGAVEAAGDHDGADDVGHDASDGDAVEAAPRPRASERALRLAAERKELRRLREAERQRASEAPPARTEARAPDTFTLDQLRRMARQDPIRFMQEAGGIDPTYVNRFWENGGRPPQEDQVELLRQEMAEREARMQASISQREQELRQREDRNRIGAELSTPEARERFEHLLSQGMFDDPAREVHDLIEADLDRQRRAGVRRPRAMSTEQAAQRIEDWVDARVAEEVRILSASKKGRQLLSKMGIAPEGDPPADGTEARSRPQRASRVDPEQQGFLSGLAAEVDKRAGKARAPARRATTVPAKRGIDVASRQALTPVSKEMSREEIGRLILGGIGREEN